jgi:hypothetical protein
MKRYFSLILAIAATVSAQIVPSTGNVRGPTSATDNAVARYDGTTGKLIQNSGVTIDDSGNATFAGKVGIGVSPASWELNLQQSAVNSAVRIISPTALGLNDSSIYIAWASGSKALIAASYESTGSYRPLVLSAGGVDSLTLDTSGNATFAGQVNILNSNSYLKADSSNLVYETYAGKGHQFKTGGTTALTLDSSQALRLNAYGAGTLTTDSSGNVTATSDERAKNITGTFTKGLAEVIKLTPKTYTWKPETGLNTTDEVASLTAQDLIAAGIPEAVSTYRTVADLNDDGTPKLDADGKPLTKRIDATYTVSDRTVIAALVNAVKELKAEVDALKAARK